MKTNNILFFIGLKLLFSLSFAFAEPNDLEECKLSCDQIVKSISKKQFTEAHKRFIAILLRDYENLPEGANYGNNTYFFYNDALKINDKQESCEDKMLAHCIMVENFDILYQQQADTLSKEIVIAWDNTSQRGLAGLMLYLDSAIESINILQPAKIYKSPKNVDELNDNNQITHFIIRRMLKMLDPDLVNKYLNSMKDLKQRVAIEYKNKHSLNKLSTLNTKETVQSYNSIETLVEKIVKVTNKHDYQEIVKLLDEEFYEIQLNEIHKGDKTTFANEFFCGDLKEKYTCMVFEDIKNIKKKSIKKTDSAYMVVFEVTNQKGETIQTSNVWVKAISVNDHLTTYRMYGPAG